MKPVGKLDAVKPLVQFDERGRETERRRKARATAPFLDSTDHTRGNLTDRRGTMGDVAAAGLRRNDPAAHGRQVEDGYIRGVAGNRPAVISVNMFASALAVNEMLARLHPYREEPNGAFAAVTLSLASMELIYDPEEGICDILG
jgi:hypothetical protein